MSRPLLNRRLEGLGTTIFAEMSARALVTGSVNLGQGFPDRDGPAKIAQVAADAILAGRGNQYPPGPGVPELRQAIAAHDERFYGLRYDPDGEILVTAGATEAIAAAMLALVEPGDEVIAFEPYYDSYAANIAMAGGVRVPVTLRPPHFRPDLAELARAITGRTRLILLNSPHNPTGSVFTRDELAAIAALAVERDLLVVTDEVYEHLVFDGEHVPIAQFPGMRDRTVSVSSAGKTFSFTGWKIGWVKATPELVTAVKTAKQFLTFVSGGPFQYAVAEALALPDEYYARLRDDLMAQRDLLCAGLSQIGFEVYQPQGTYFVTADIRPLGERDGVEFCRNLPDRAGVVAIPTAIFYDHPEAARGHVRFAFCKQPEVLTEALHRLSRLTRLDPHTTGPSYRTDCGVCLVTATSIVITIAASKPRPSGRRGNAALLPPRKCRYRSLVCSYVPVPSGPLARPGGGAARTLRPRPVRLEPRSRAAPTLAPGAHERSGYLEQCRQLTAARAEHPWLAAGSQVVQQQALRDFAQALANYLRGTHDRPSWRKAAGTRDSGFVAVRPGHVRRLSLATPASGSPTRPCGRLGTVLNPEVVQKLMVRTLPAPSRWPALTPREREKLGADGRGPLQRPRSRSACHHREGGQQARGRHLRQAGSGPSDDDNRRVLAVLAYLGS
jgi:N-succinyldiaminopimelate aminotransferase